MQIPRTLTSIRITPRVALLAAAIFHLAFTLSVFSAGRSELFPSQFDHDGIGEFAIDSRAFREQANSMADLLYQGEITLWADGAADFHAKVYSLDLVLMRPLLGSTIIAVEPLNLIYYLGILTLTFALTSVVASRRAAWVASAIAGLWPSLVLHTTQLIREPLLISAILLLVLVIIQVLTKVHNWRSALISALMTISACLVIWKCRSEMWPVLWVIVSGAALLFIIRMVRERKLLAGNLVLIALLSVLTIAIPRTTSVAPKPGARRRVQDASISGVIARARNRFIKDGLNNSGSTIDSNVTFAGPIDIIKYLPRALEIGYLAPFPPMWFGAGHNVGLLGRLLSGLEMSLTYLIEALAFVFVWRRRRCLETWLLLLTTTTGVLALGMVVVNIGTLYRMRYPFWILTVIMAAPIITHYFSRTSNEALAPKAERT
jgi:hypothetical protein